MIKSDKSFSSKRQRGGVILMVAGGLVVVAGMTAFAVDIGRALMVRNQIQNVADAAALAGAGKIGNIVDQNWAAACAAAESSIADNAVDGGSLVVDLGNADDVEITVGIWDSSTSTYVEHGSCDDPVSLLSVADVPDHPEWLPSIRVTAMRNGGSVSGPLQTYFARVIGTNSINMSADAIAAVGAVAELPADKMFPMAIGSCMLDGLLDLADSEPGQLLPPITSYVNTGKVKGGGCDFEGQWTTLNIPSLNSESTDDVSELIDGTASDDGTILEVGDTLAMKDGLAAKLYMDVLANADLNKTYLIPVVDSALLANGSLADPGIITFIAVTLASEAEVVSEYGNGYEKKAVYLKTAESVKIVDSKPVIDGSLLSFAVVTRAVIVN